MSDTPTRLGAFPVEHELGRGGMGVVYLARDPKLDRSVAIKVLPEAFARDPERLARFEREARLLASLNHPNIAAIHGLEHAEGQQLLVLEYVPGDTLAARTGRGALPLDEALDVCRQIAAAVEAAHEGGVIHRDLKPGNVKNTPEGRVKVLDFGLAKGDAASTSESGPDLSQSPTLSFAGTGVGVILGTAAFMSPEQARGRAVDKRTDIWSFGCVLFECLTGRQVFQGETVSDTIARILEREPDWAALPAQTPPRVRELLHRCLEKDAKKRLRDIGDARIELEEAIAARTTATRAASARAEARGRAALTPRTLALAALLVVAGAAAGVGVWSMVGPGAGGSNGSAGGLVRLSVDIPKSIRAFAAGITPDGQTLIIRGASRTPDGVEESRARLYTRRLDEHEIKPIPGTDGVQSYTMSPDGTWLAFVATISEESSQRRLAKVPVDGSSPPVALADWDDDWGLQIVWLKDGDILNTSNEGTKYFRLPSGGGAPTAGLKLDTGPVSGNPRLIRPLPGDRGVFFWMESWGQAGYQQDVWILDPKTGKTRRLLESAGNARYSPTGHVVFTRGEALMAAPFDLGKLQVTGELTAMPGSVRTANAWANGDFELSQDGTIIFAPGGRMGTDRRLVTVDTAGNVTSFAPERRAYENPPRISRDGRKASVIIADAKGTYQVWVADLDRPGLKRVLALPGADCNQPVWSPDGQWFAFHRNAEDKDDGIYLQRADGAGPARTILSVETKEVSLVPTAWAPDGSGLLVSRLVGGKGDLLFLPIPAAGERGPLRDLRTTSYDERHGRFSPDGKFVAWSSDESGKREVYVAGYGSDGSLGAPLMVSNGGGPWPKWAGDGRRLFFDDEANRVMSVTIGALPVLSASTPVVAWDLRKLRLVATDWDIMPDGRLLAIQRSEEEDDITRFDVVLNWSQELRERMSKAAGAGRGR